MFFFVTLFEFFVSPSQFFLWSDSSVLYTVGFSDNSWSFIGARYSIIFLFGYFLVNILKIKCLKVSIYMKKQRHFRILMMKRRFFRYFFAIFFPLFFDFFLAIFANKFIFRTIIPATQTPMRVAVCHSFEKHFLEYFYKQLTLITTIYVLPWKIWMIYNLEQNQLFGGILENEVFSLFLFLCSLFMNFLGLSTYFHIVHSN